MIDIKTKGESYYQSYMSVAMPKISMTCMSKSKRMWVCARAVTQGHGRQSLLLQLASKSKIRSMHTDC